MADRQFETGGFAARLLAQVGDELQQAQWRGERRVLGGRDAVLPHRYVAGGRNLLAELGRRQYAAMAGLGTLRQLHLDHLHLRINRLLGEARLVETAVMVAAAEIARAQLPDQIATAFAMVGRDRAFAGVVVEATALGTAIEGADRRCRQRTETHRRNVEHAGRIRLL